MKIVKVDPLLLDYSIIIDEAKEWFDKHYNRRPRVKFTVSKYNPGSSGRNMGGWYIHISAGRRLDDFIYVVDHEFAHSVVGTVCGHDDTFYAALLKITKDRGHSVTYMLKREMNYKPQAVRRLMTRHRIGLPKEN